MTKEPTPGAYQNETSDVPERFQPANLHEASLMSQRGQHVDVTALIPPELEGASGVRKVVQRVFDWLADTNSSQEYALHTQEIKEILTGVTGQVFLFDIEGTLMSDVQLDQSSELIYYVIPWMRPLIETLLENGNQVGLWTSAKAESLARMRKAMGPEMEALQAIAREDYEKVVKAFQSKSNGELTDEQVLDVMQSVYPDANMGSVMTGNQIFSEDTLESFTISPNSFLRASKYPQLFLSPTNGFLVDDDGNFIESATSEGWPKPRAVKCDCNPNRENAVEVARSIASAI